MLPRVGLARPTLEDFSYAKSDYRVDGSLVATFVQVFLKHAVYSLLVVQ